ncbi:MAG: endonuclease/exonuclease/phosphatase family protein [Betaproteobacteria bacterium]|nr:endonuclease/exonuclease/phosphatase family protein [Betaproteobacteria bacterium]MDE2623186.1 endonuclease/exonuclease/phosphatase family protein [Betaproteobacteria bacterium]
MAGPYTILLSNLGYARDIGGQISHHVRYLHRHFYCAPTVQHRALDQLSDLIAREDPDLCCFVEIDQGSFPSAGLNQLKVLSGGHYGHAHIENKYGLSSSLRSFFVTRGKSNGFMAKQPFPFETLYLRHGIKRLVYKIRLEHNLVVYFSHLSLNRRARQAQLLEIRQLLHGEPGEAAFLGDFNLLTGLSELGPLLEQSDFVLLNRPDEPTFTFHKRSLVLDVCLCSRTLAARSSLRVLPQPYSDHAALLLQVGSSA